jgi:1,4-dihydroxy-2-naphthoate octaprenyltransferase
MALLLWWRDAGAWAWGSAGAAFGIMLMYNLWSKTSRFPPLMDLAQAVPFGLMVVVGASLTSPDGAPGASTVAAVVWVTTWEALTNVFGGLRDLEFDARVGLRTTPLMLGARVVDGRVVIPARLQRWVYAGLAVLPVLSLLVLWVHDADHRWATLQLGAALALRVLAGLLAWTAWRAAIHGCREMTRIVVVHLGVSLLPIVVIFATEQVGWLLVLLGSAFVLPTLKFAARPVRYWTRSLAGAPDAS